MCFVAESVQSVHVLPDARITKLQIKYNYLRFYMFPAVISNLYFIIQNTA
jgi:hypothetical protein